jgi:crossover junction endodeoxyribonuclease RuvC
MPVRLHSLYMAICELVERVKPDALATEKLVFGANRTTALEVARAMGVVLLAAAERGLVWEEYTPARVKQSVTGNGSAEKRQVQFMVAKILGLDSAPRPDDAADAIAVALCHAQEARVRSL